MDNDKLNIEENKLERFVSDCEKTVILHVLVKNKGNIIRRRKTFRNHKTHSDLQSS